MWRIRVLLLAILGVLTAGLLGIFISANNTATAAQQKSTAAAPSGGCITPPAGWLRGTHSMRQAAPTMTDLVGTYSGAYVNNPAVDLGHYVLNSRTFDGVNQYAESATGPNFGTGDFTIDAWVNLTSTGVQVIVDKRNVIPVGYLLLVNNGTLGIQLGDGNGAPVLYTMSGSPTINDGQWHFIAAVLQRIGINRLTLMADSVVQTFNNAPAGSLNNSRAFDWPAVGPITSTLLITTSTAV